MPIKPENKERYPANWKALSHRIRFDRAGGRCECDGRCGADHKAESEQLKRALDLADEHTESLYFAGDYRRCPERHGSDALWRLLFDQDPARVILTTAHLDQTPENNDERNLMALCQRCHLAYDRAANVAESAKTRRRQARERDRNQLDLFQRGDRP